MRMVKVESQSWVTSSVMDSLMTLLRDADGFFIPKQWCWRLQSYIHRARQRRLWRKFDPSQQYGDFREVPRVIGQVDDHSFAYGLLYDDIYSIVPEEYRKHVVVTVHRAPMHPDPLNAQALVSWKYPGTVSGTRTYRRYADLTAAKDPLPGGRLPTREAMRELGYDV